jgi:hypothetical protein
MPLDFAQRHVTPFLLIDYSLEFLLHGGDLIWILDDFHPKRGIIDKGIQRNQAQTGFERRRRVNSVEPDQALGHRNSGEVGVNDRQIVAMPHGSEGVQ